MKMREQESKSTPVSQSTTPNFNLVLYQPPASTQLLPYERMISTALVTWFKLNGQQLTVIERPNAEQMSPTGAVPFVCNDTLIVPGDWYLITNHFQKHHNFAQRPKDEFHKFLTGYILQAMIHICWCDPVVYEKFTSKRYMCNLKWPINRIVCWKKRREMIKICSSREIHSISNWEPFFDVLKQIDQRLDTKRFIGENKPNETDALLYGLLDAIDHVEHDSIFSDHLPSLNQFSHLKRYLQDIRTELNVE